MKGNEIMVIYAQIPQIGLPWGVGLAIWIVAREDPGFAVI